MRRTEGFGAFPCKVACPLVSRTLDAADHVGQIGPEIAMFGAPKERMGYFRSPTMSHAMVNA
jgi:hypothetical protein